MSSSKVLLHVNPSKLIIFLLLLSSLLPKSIGIRRDDTFKQAATQELKFHASIYLDKSSSFVERSTKENGGAREVILCKEGHCTGKTRKLDALTSTPTSTSTFALKHDVDGETKAELPMSESGQRVISNSITTPSSPIPSNENHRDQVLASHDHYVDLQDIAEMDYSPARRKPPIHN